MLFIKIFMFNKAFLSLSSEINEVFEYKKLLMEFLHVILSKDVIKT